MPEPRTERPTARRRREARRRGVVARSPLLSAGLVLLAGWLVGLVTGPELAARLVGVTRSSFTRAADTPVGRLGDELFEAVASGLQPLWPWLAGIWLTAVLVGLIQVGPMFAAQATRADWSRVHPGRGLSRLFRAEAAVSTVIMAIGAIGLLAGTTYGIATALPAWGRLPTIGWRPGLVGLFASLRIWALPSLLGVAGVGLLDLVWRRHCWRQSLLMTRSEVEHERRQHQGDPIYRSERRRLHRQALAHDWTRAVGQARVVIEAARVAVALAYEPGSTGAPRVVAIGRGHRAPRLTDLARRLGTPVVAAPALAESLARLTVGAAVPTDLYEPVAEILSELSELTDSQPGR